MAEDTVTIKLIKGQRLFPCHSVPYFSENVPKWTQLLEGETIEIPLGVLDQIPSNGSIETVFVKPEPRKVLTPRSRRSGSTKKKE